MMNRDFWQVIKMGDCFGVTCNGFLVRDHVQARSEARRIMDRLKRKG